MNGQKISSPPAVLPGKEDIENNGKSAQTASATQLPFTSPVTTPMRSRYEPSVIEIQVMYSAHAPWVSPAISPAKLSDTMAQNRKKIPQGCQKPCGTCHCAPCHQKISKASKPRPATPATTSPVLSPLEEPPVAATAASSVEKWKASCSSSSYELPARSRTDPSLKVR